MCRKRVISRILALGLFGLLVLSACAGQHETAAPTEAVEPTEAEHMEEAEEEEHMDEHAPEEHMEGEAHDVPDEAAAIPNPIEASDESVAQGAEIYAQNCAVCHGEDGEGSGPAAAGLEMRPADLHEDHVQANSDGALFYIISHSSPESPMPAWEDELNEDERWHVVNFLRTFGE